MIILLTGLPGTGKTEFAKMLATELANTIVIRNDELRAELFKVEGGKGFDENQAERLDELVTEKTKDAVTTGQNVILDRVSGTEDKRQKFKLLAQELVVPFVLIYLTAPETLIEERITNRLLQDPLGVPFSAYLYQKERYDPIVGATYMVVNDSGLEDLREQARKIGEELRLHILVSERS